MRINQESPAEARLAAITLFCVMYGCAAQRLDNGTGACDNGNAVNTVQTQTNILQVFKMNRDETTPTRERVIQGEAYEEAGQPGFSFTIPQPFVSDDFTSVGARLGISPAGLAVQTNQVLAENLGNNMAARIKKAVKDKTDLPTQEDMDSLYSAYDFSGSRAGGAQFGSPYERHLWRLAANFIRKLIKAKGYQSMSAPVTVAKKDTAPSGNQIDYDTFEAEVQKLIDEEGPWGEIDAFITLRTQLAEEAQSEADKEVESARAAEQRLASLDGLTA